MKLLGITLDINNPHYPLSCLGLYGYFEDKEIHLIQLADIDLLESFIDLYENERYERVVLYSIDELADWHELRELTNICDKYDLEYTLVKEDLHSDKEVKIGDLTGII